MFLTERRQQVAVRNRMNGLEDDVDPADLRPPYDYLYEVVSRGRDFHSALQLLSMAGDQYADLKGPVEAIINASPGEKRVYETLADIIPELPETEWLWLRWVPRGLLTVLAADPGIGKTNVALDLSRRIIHGLDGPDGEQLNVRSRRVIYIDAEDFIVQIAERVTAWQMDTRRFYPVQRPEDRMLNMLDKENQEMVMDMCFDLEPDLIVFDSLSTISMKSENAVEDTREVLGFLTFLARQTGAGVVVVHHMRKPQNGRGGYSISMHDMRGSSHISAMARSVIGMHVAGEDPNGPRWLKVIKTNLCKYPQPLSARYVPSPGNPEIAMMEYKVVEAPDLPDNLAGECAEWLEQYLIDNGPTGYMELKEAADEAGYKENTLQNARKALDWRVIDTRGSKVRGNQWALHGHYDPDLDREEEETADIPRNGNGQNSHMVTWAMCDTPPPKKMTPPPHTWPCVPCVNSKNGDFRRKVLKFPRFGQLPTMLAPRRQAQPAALILRGRRKKQK